MSDHQIDAARYAGLVRRLDALMDPPRVYHWKKVVGFIKGRKQWRLYHGATCVGTVTRRGNIYTARAAATDGVFDNKPEARAWVYTVVRLG